MYAEVAVNAPVQGTFHYHLPPGAQAQVGQLVQVAFGTALQHGIIIALHETSDLAHTKPIDAILDPQPVVTPFQIEIARWIADTYRNPISPCLWLFLPPGLTGRRDILVTLCDAAPANLDALAARVVALLERRGPLRGQQLSAALPGQPWQAAVEALAQAGAVRCENVLAPPRVRQRIVRTAALAIAPEQVDAVACHLGHASKRADLLEVIAAAGDGGLPVDEALRIAEAGLAVLSRLKRDGLVTTSRPDGGGLPRAKLAIPREAVDEALIGLRGGERLRRVLRALARERGPIEVSWLYAQTGAALADLRRLEEEGLITLGEAQTWRDSLSDRFFVPTVAPPFTVEQLAAWAEIEAQIRRWDWATEGGDDLPWAIFLLHGVTGSGKTEIYLRAIELTLAQGRQAVFLVPEIALTAQTVRRVASRFPGQTVIVHGLLSEGERYDTWRRARDGLVSVAVGARSALFTPFPDVGLVILDEEHDHSYKQDIGMSHLYHARQVAEEMVRRRGGVLLLGSATPDLESMHRA
ncbi:MAG: DEAD/DEAH box helicase, partial [Aggregatilineales bacterium]